MIVTWIHVIAAMFWIGGMLFFVLVFIPSVREGLSDTQKTALISRVGKRFRTCGWIALGLLIGTGLLILYLGGLSLSDYGRPLWIKLSLVFLMISLSFLHDVVLGPRSIRVSQITTGPHRLQIIVRWMARFNLLVGLLVVLAAVYLVHAS
ncbi:MAG: DUF4149 domain-containing protein [Nitrospiria bacterium]